tara:strand:- start:13 stop:318 length:306 start_codon:yes stop_codon:yes gene_type:complete
MVESRMGDLHCSESYCNLHDYRINTLGICLRRDALERSEVMGRRMGPLSFNDVHRGLPQRDDIDLEEHIVAIVRQEVQKAMREHAPPPAPRPRQRKGGTPI